MISAVILAAGTSSRMGVPKQLQQIKQRALVRIVAENVISSAVGEVVLVTGHLREEVVLAVAGLPLRIVYNPGYKEGQGSSLAAGIRELSAGSSAVAVFMADQPLIVPPLVDMLLERFRKSGCQALRPVFRGCPGHPVIMDRVLFPELLKCRGDQGARQFLGGLGERLCCLTVDDEAVVFDIDTPEDLARLKDIQLCKKNNCGR